VHWIVAMKIKRFTADEIETLRLMASAGHPATSIAKRLHRTPEAIRSRACALGIQFRAGRMPKCGSRFRIPDRLWQDISDAALARGMKPTKLAHQTLANVARDRLWDAVNDAPRKPPTSPLKRRRVLPPPISSLLAPRLEGYVAGGELGGVLDG